MRAEEINSLTNLIRCSIAGCNITISMILSTEEEEIATMYRVRGHLLNALSIVNNFAVEDTLKKDTVKEDTITKDA